MAGVSLCWDEQCGGGCQQGTGSLLWLYLLSGASITELNHRQDLVKVGFFLFGHNWSTFMSVEAEC